MFQLHNDTIHPQLASALSFLTRRISHNSLSALHSILSRMPFSRYGKRPIHSNLFFIHFSVFLLDVSLLSMISRIFSVLISSSFHLSTSQVTFLTAFTSPFSHSLNDNKFSHVSPSEITCYSSGTIIGFTNDESLRPPRQKFPIHPNFHSIISFPQFSFRLFVSTSQFIRYSGTKQGFVVSLHYTLCSRATADWDGRLGFFLPALSLIQISFDVQVCATVFLLAVATDAFSIRDFVRVGGKRAADEPGRC